MSRLPSAPPSPVFPAGLSEDDVLLTRREMATYLRVGVSTAEAWAARGYGPRGRKIGYRVLYSLREVCAFARGEAA